MSDDRGPDSAYVAWKGWVNETPFGSLDAGERAYFHGELRKVKRDAGAISEVLEVGFGNGSFLAYCKEQGWRIAGTELDPSLVDAGTRSGFDVFNADHLSKFEDCSFDLIVLFDVLEHIPQELTVTFLSTMRAKLRPGGRLLMRFPNADSWLGNPVQNGDPTHVNAIGYLKMTYFALQSSLEIVSFTGANRRGFATSLVHGIYSITAGPVVRVFAALQRAVYFPKLPVVLYASNVVCVAVRREGN